MLRVQGSTLIQEKMAQLDATNSMPGNWLGLGLVNNNLKVKLLKVGLASSWPGIELGWHRVGGIEAYPTQSKESVASSRRSSAGWMSENMGTWSVEVGRRHP